MIQVAGRQGHELHGRQGRQLRRERAGRAARRLRDACGKTGRRRAGRAITPGRATASRDGREAGSRCRRQRVWRGKPDPRSSLRAKRAVQLSRRPPTPWCRSGRTARGSGLPTVTSAAGSAGAGRRVQGAVGLAFSWLPHLLKRPQRGPPFQDAWRCEGQDPSPGTATPCREGGLSGLIRVSMQKENGNATSKSISRPKNGPWLRRKCVASRARCAGPPARKVRGPCAPVSEERGSEPNTCGKGAGQRANRDRSYSRPWWRATGWEKKRGNADMRNNDLHQNAAA